ncbi:putative regulatory protein, FmdB family [Modicisalibacter muralis]|uniref:Putative regulatory protein, FmdB family n=1 Tax=Modicisalibacter muralis TaxID=119000 RepID=A0A1G9GD56_9GAMM|nr:putative regulatory protein, FmdB family [Halomonas muralis]
MPIYEYECKACGHRLEKLQKLSAAPLKDCPSCEQSELSRLVSAAGFRLAGGGWYETDFKSGGKKNLAGDAGDKKTTSSADGKASPSVDKKAPSSADAKSSPGKGSSSKSPSSPDSKATA